jgi:predicted amidohydrolase
MLIIRIGYLAALGVLLLGVVKAADTVRIRVAGAQIPVGRDVAVNIEALTRAIEFAAREKADVLVTPEGSLSGYTPEFDAAATQHALATVVQRAREARVALVLGTCFETTDGRRYNAQRFYDREGGFVGFHSKILLCRRMSNPAGKGEVDCFQTKPLSTFKLLGLTVGGLICNDMWANPEWTPMEDPHLASRLADMGAEIIFISANAGASDGDGRALSRAFHESNIRMRTRVAKRWVVTVNAARPADAESLPAPSGVLAPDGTWAVLVGPPTEQFFVHTIDISRGGARVSSE